MCISTPNAASGSMLGLLKGQLNYSLIWPHAKCMVTLVFLNQAWCCSMLSNQLEACVDVTCGCYNKLLLVEN